MRCVRACSCSGVPEPELPVVASSDDVLTVGAHCACVDAIGVAFEGEEELPGARAPTYLERTVQDAETTRCPSGLIAAGVDPLGVAFEGGEGRPVASSRDLQRPVAGRGDDALSIGADRACVDPIGVAFKGWRGAAQSRAPRSSASCLPGRRRRCAGRRG